MNLNIQIVEVISELLVKIFKNLIKVRQKSVHELIPNNYDIGLYQK